MCNELFEINCECFWVAIGALGTIGGFIIAIFMMCKNNQLKKIDNLLKLREIFFMHEKDLFQANKESVNEILVFSYLGLFEIIYDMYLKKEIDLDTIKNYYQYKIKMVFDSKSSFYSTLENNKKNWSKLYELKKLIDSK